MRDFGLGKRSLEERIQEEATALVEQMKAEGGLPFDPNKWLGPAVSNIICSINFGKRYAILRLLILFSNKTHDLFLQKNARMLHLLRVDGVENSVKNFHLDTVTLTYTLLPWPLWPLTLNLATLALESMLKIEMFHFYLELWPWPWPTFPNTRLENGIFAVFTFVTLTLTFNPRCVC